MQQMVYVWGILRAKILIRTMSKEGTGVAVPFAEMVKEGRRLPRSEGSDG